MYLLVSAVWDIIYDLSANRKKKQDNQNRSLGDVYDSLYLMRYCNS